MRSVKRVAIEVPPSERFELQIRRGTGTTPAVLAGGLIGGAIVETVNRSQDDAQAERVAAHLESPDCAAPIAAALQETLSASQRLRADLTRRPRTDAELAGYDALVRVEVESCGFRVLELDRQMVSAYADVTLRVKTRTTARDGWSARLSFAGNRRMHAADLERDGALVRDELQQALRSAGRHLANELLYP